MLELKGSVIVDISTRVLVPVIQLFALYVIFHGHYSPGGGFQGGALLAASVLVQRIVFGRVASAAGFAPWCALPCGIVGIAIYFGTGLAGLPDGRFLQYDSLPFGLDAVWLRNTGILLVEIGVAFAVMGILVSIFDSLAEGEDSVDDGEDEENVGATSIPGEGAPT